jgi:hypothetical protein
MTAWTFVAAVMLASVAEAQPPPGDRWLCDHALEEASPSLHRAIDGPDFQLDCAGALSAEHSRLTRAARRRSIAGGVLLATGLGLLIGGGIGLALEEDEGCSDDDWLCLDIAPSVGGMLMAASIKPLVAALVLLARASRLRGRARSLLRVLDLEAGSGRIGLSLSVDFAG